MGSRFTLLAIGVFAAYGLLFFRIYDLQILKGQEYKAAAESQYAASLGLPSANRGSIYFTDMDGKRLPAAINKDFPVIYAVPSVIEDPAATAAQAALMLGQPKSSLEAQFSKKNSQYVLLDKDPTAEMVARVSEAKIKGIYTENIPRRFYPFGAMASQVLGFVGPNKDNNGTSGKYGVEKLYNDELSRSGEVTLTIDPTIQAQGEHLIQKLLSKHSGKKASMIVEDVKTGRILAMGSLPSFDPNNYGSTDISRFLNPVVQEIYEPGSVMKIITMASALDSGKITPDTLYNDTGQLKLDGYTIHNWDLKAHGTVTMTQAIEGSLNTGAAFAQQKTGNAAFRGYLEKFGFDKKTGIELPGELAGDLRQLAPGKPQVNFATASFGQGIAVTPLGMLQSLATIANGGKLMRPYIDVATGPKEVRRVVSAEAARQATQMMVAAVDNGKIAAVSGFEIAGKTGTAQVANKGRSGYSDEVNHTYIGFLPASDPKVIVLLKLDEPAGAPLAGTTVVPVFKEFAQFLINYYNIAPDRVSS